MNLEQFLNSDIYKSFEEDAVKHIGYWSCIMQDCMEDWLYRHGLTNIDCLRFWINTITKKFKKDHESEIRAAWAKVFEETNTNAIDVIEVQAAINAIG